MPDFPRSLRRHQEEDIKGDTLALSCLITVAFADFIITLFHTTENMYNPMK